MRDHFWTDTHSGEQCVNCGVYGRTGDDPGMCPGDPTENENKQLRADLAAMTRRAQARDRELLFSTRERLKREQLPGESFAAVVDRLVRERDAARADVERLREALASVLTLEIAPHICRVCRRTIDACDADVTTLPCPGAHGRYLLTETAPKETT